MFAITIFVSIFLSIFLGIVSNVPSIEIEKNQYWLLAVGFCHSLVALTGITIIFDGHFFKSRAEFNKLIIRYRKLIVQYDETLQT